jgi:putative FmdB family regulatory protein
MPTYEYACRSCGENLEVFQAFSDKPLKKHATCGGDLQKVFHARGIVFKGSGFYATDSKGSASIKAPDSGEKKTADTKNNAKPSKATTAASSSSSESSGSSSKSD